MREQWAFSLMPESVEDRFHFELIRRVFYNPFLGTFIRRKDGKPLGFAGSDGYLMISVCGGRYPAHRLAWFYVYGRWPSGHVHHKNHVKTDNSIANLEDLPAGEHARQHKASPRYGYGRYMRGSKANKRCSPKCRENVC